MKHTIGEVEKAIGVHINLIQQWERELGLTRPKRDKKARMVYSDEDIRTLKKLKFFLTERGLSMKDAKARVASELAFEKLGTHGQLALIKRDLQEAFDAAKRMGKRFDFEKEKKEER